VLRGKGAKLDRALAALPRRRRGQRVHGFSVPSLVNRPTMGTGQLPKFETT
jgi:seryl-tRNA synthetase